MKTSCSVIFFGLVWIGNLFGQSLPHLSAGGTNLPQFTSSAECDYLTGQCEQDEARLTQHFKFGNLDESDYKKQLAIVESVKNQLTRTDLEPYEKLSSLSNDREFRGLQGGFNAICCVPDPTLRGDGPQIPGLTSNMEAFPSVPHPLTSTDVEFSCVCGVANSADISGARVIGSCFYLTNGYFVTAYHVMQNESELYVFSSQKSPGDIVPKYVFRIDLTSLLVDPDKDVCIFRTDPTLNGIFANSVFKPPECFSENDPPILSKLKVAGFPRGSFMAIVSDNCFFIKRLPQWDKNKGNLLAMGTTWKGYSGSPLVTQDGCVVGILRWQASAEDVNSDGTPVRFAPTEDNAFGAIGIEYALRLLNPTTASTQ